MAVKLCLIGSGIASLLLALQNSGLHVESINGTIPESAVETASPLEIIRYLDTDMLAEPFRVLEEFEPSQVPRELNWNHFHYFRNDTTNILLHEYG